MKRSRVRELVKENGEVHIVVEEHEHVLGESDEDFIGIRSGENYVLEDDVIVIEDGPTTHYIPYERIVYAHTPGSFPD